MTPAADGSPAHPEAPEITREELAAKMERGDPFVLVDALSQGHFEMSHLPGAVSLPYEFVDEAERVLPDKSAEVIVYCMNRACEASGEERASCWRWATSSLPIAH